MKALAKFGKYSNAIATGTIEAVAERLITFKWLRGAFGKAGKKAVTQGMTKTIFNVAKNSGMEAAEEGVVEFSSNFFDLVMGVKGVDASKMNGNEIFNYLTRGVPDAMIFRRPQLVAFIQPTACCSIKSATLKCRTLTLI